MQGPSSCQKLKFKCSLCCCCCCLLGSIKIILNPISSGTTKWVAILCNCLFSFFFFFLPCDPFIWNFFSDKRRTKGSFRSWNESFRSRQGWSQMFYKSQNSEFWSLEKPKFRILKFGKAKIQNSNVWKSQKREFQSLEKPKLTIPMFGHA